ncbi:hypothetical protein HMPREF1529_00906 [Microbacterium sp. oral taxon 186 str. F0373]|uniref:hypothetical protein n=1 Tax=Microbacterium sp. oral taxon 186 TaxID=712383 RepID=UPI00034E7E7C|nr:hypothetical protein [Microbacterium sp. oral taxon 186]EPD85891.1 hypothetical protein HMPREF1529_00906 [Microbacterium sp. oral taxon 186 str. F0373]
MATIAVPPLRRGRSTTESTRRWAVLGALGVGAAFAWFTISLFSGPSAHAADDTNNPLGSLVSGVSSTLEKATTPVLDPVAEILSPVAETVAPVVESASPPVGGIVSSVAPVLEPLAPVGEVVAPIGSAVGEVVSPLAPVIAPVTGAVKPIVDAAAPVTDAVISLPVVGELVTPITNVVVPPGGAPASSLPPSTDALEPTEAALAVLSATWDQAMHGVTTTANAAAMSLGTAVSSFVPGAGALARNGSVPTGAPGGWGLLGPTLDATSFFSSGAGFSFGAGAVLAFGLFAAHRAWVLRRRPEDDSALPAPVFATDVCPD